MTTDWQPRLTGDLVELRPAVREDFDELYAAASDPLIWELHPAHDRWQEPVFRTYFDAKLASAWTLIAVDRASGRVIGMSRFSYEATEPGEIEIGSTFLARDYWGGTYNGEMKRLMLSHAFRFVDRAIFLIGTDNVRSRRAIEKIGGYLTGREHHAEMAGQPVVHVIYAIDRPL